MTRPRGGLSDGARLEVLYEDETPYGSALTRRCDALMQAACRPIAEQRKNSGMAHVVRHSRQLLAEAFQGGLAELYERPGMLREACLYPPAEQVRPVALAPQRVDGGPPAPIRLPDSVAADLAGWLDDWRRGAAAPRTPQARGVWEALREAGLLVDEVPRAAPPPESELLWVGHATVQLGREHKILVDPFLFPRSPKYPERYQPLGPRELREDLAAVFITHSHPDHFDLSSLLQLGADVPIYVPAVARESLLSVDMARRLEQLGFRSVHRLEWGDRVRVAGHKVRALPFYGEQPTAGARLHPEVRNQGCTYLVETASDGRHLLLVDSGRDAAGDVKQLAEALRGERIDALLGGYRGFCVYPVHYLFSSVARYLLFVPEDRWEVRQQLMNDPHDLIDCAELAGARLVVPYADGGAPWYWELGLGPALDRPDAVNPAIDPPPEQVLDACSRRSSSREGAIASPVTTRVLRPGEGIAGATEHPQLVRGPYQHWPYAP